MSDIGEPFNKLFRDKFSLKNPEKHDRELIISALMNTQGDLVTQVAKYLQGKTFKEIKNIVYKVTKGGKDRGDEMIKRLA